MTPTTSLLSSIRYISRRGIEVEYINVNPNTYIRMQSAAKALKNLECSLHPNHFILTLNDSKFLIYSRNWRRSHNEHSYYLIENGMYFFDYLIKLKDEDSSL